MAAQQLCAALLPLPPGSSARSPRPRPLQLRRPPLGQVPGAAAGWGAAPAPGGGEFAGAPPPERAAPAAADHLIEDHTSADMAEASSNSTHSSSAMPSTNGKPHLPSNMYAPFPADQLPPDGHTLTLKEQKCDPEVERCRTPIHVWESRCTACGGSGTQRWVPSRQRQRHHVLSVCLLCSGLGYVRHTSTHSVPYVNGSGPHTTIGRPPAPDVKPSRFGFGGRWPGSSGSGSGSGSSKPKK